MLLFSRGENRTVLIRGEVPVAVEAIGGRRIHPSESPVQDDPDCRQDDHPRCENEQCLWSMGDPSSDAVDQDAQRRIENFLQSRDIHALRRIQIEVCSGVVSVHGCVNTYYEKQMATACCQRVAGVLRVLNELEVV